ncbi:MAG: hypothetical protein Q8P67_24455 [archaeon]|nr:hypothetical protein [archaeon]
MPWLCRLSDHHVTLLKIVRRSNALLEDSVELAELMLQHVRMVRGPVHRSLCIAAHVFFSGLCANPQTLRSVLSLESLKQLVSSTLELLLDAHSAAAGSPALRAAFELASTLHRCILVIVQSMQKSSDSAEDPDELDEIKKNQEGDGDGDQDDEERPGITPWWLTFPEHQQDNGLVLASGVESFLTVAEEHSSSNLNEHMRVESCSHGARSFKPARNLLIDNARNAFSSDESSGSTKIDVIFRCKYPVFISSFTLRRLAAYLNRAAAASGYLLVSDSQPSAEQLKVFSSLVTGDAQVTGWYASHPNSKFDGSLRPVAFWSFFDEPSALDKQFLVSSSAIPANSPYPGVKASWLVLHIARATSFYSHQIHLEYLRFEGTPLSVRPSVTLAPSRSCPVVSPSRGFVAAALCLWPPPSGSALIQLQDGVQLAYVTSAAGSSAFLGASAVMLGTAVNGEFVGPACEVGKAGYRVLLVQVTGSEVQYYLDWKLVLETPLSSRPPLLTSAGAKVASLGGQWRIIRMFLSQLKMSAAEITSRIALRTFGGELNIGMWPAVTWERIAFETPKHVSTGVWEVDSECATVRATPGLIHGCFYYEVTLAVSSASRRHGGRVGWINLGVGFTSGSSVGSDAHGYAYDGDDGQKWHAGGSEPYGQKWSAGDVVGCLLDIPNSEISFTLNGRPLGVAFAQIPPDGSQAWYPAFSFPGPIRVDFNVGWWPWRHAPPPGFQPCLSEGLGSPFVSRPSAVAASSSASAISLSAASSSSAAPPLLGSMFDMAPPAITRMQDAFSSFLGPDFSSNNPQALSELHQFCHEQEAFRNFVERQPLGSLLESLPNYNPRMVDGGWTRAHDEQLTEVLNELSTASLPVSPSAVALSDSMRESLPLLASASSEALQNRSVLLLKLSEMAPSFLAKVDWRSKDSEARRIYGALKACLLTSVKVKCFEGHLDKTRTNSLPRVSLRRLRNLTRHAETDASKHHRTVFGQLFRQLQAHPNAFWKRAAGSRSWQVTLVGEAAYDDGGPYRESIANWCDEVCSPELLDLMVHTPNHLGNVGLEKDCVIPNAAATHPKQLAMYEFLGKLMASTCYSRDLLALRFPSAFWKHLVGDELTAEDLQSIDIIAYRQLAALREHLPDDLTFEEVQGDDSMRELLPGGATMRVTPGNLEQYIRLITASKLSSFQPQMQAIVRGFSQVIPVHLLQLFTWRELQRHVCGVPDFDVEVLMSTARIEGSVVRSPSLTHFWNTLKKFTPEERCKFLRFAWGQGSLPPRNTPGWRPISINILHDVPNPAKAYPKASTCYFRVMIPLYPSEDVCRRQLLYAINHCVSIDTDGSVPAATADSSSDEDD